MEFYTPKNFKKGRLIGGMYRPIDLIILVLCLSISLLSLVIYLTTQSNIQFFVVMLLLLPLGLALFITAPIGVYHNILQWFVVFFNFQIQKKDYKWEGIYLSEEELDEEL